MEENQNLGLKDSNEFCNGDVSYKDYATGRTIRGSDFGRGNVQSVSGTNRASYSTGTGFCIGVRAVTSHRHLVPR